MTVRDIGDMFRMNFTIMLIIQNSTSSATYKIKTVATFFKMAIVFHCHYIVKVVFYVPLVKHIEDNRRYFDFLWGSRIILIITYGGHFESNGLNLEFLSYSEEVAYQ